VLALWLTRLGVKVRVLDKAAGPGTTSRALLVQARTLELYRQLDLADAVVAQGHRSTAVNVWVGGEAKARIELGAIGKGLTPYPYLEVFPQDEHERLLVERLSALGVTVERNTELLEFTDHGSHVSARYRTADGSAEVCEALFIAGCDGARSTVRNVIGADFPGGTYRQVFYVADVRGSGPTMNGEMHVDLDEADFLMVFTMEAGTRARLVGTVSDERANRAETLTFADVSQKVIETLKLKVDSVDWFSTYRVHHRVADRFRKGRAFLVGDAGHIHSPAGGQGMNTGIATRSILRGSWRPSSKTRLQTASWKATKPSGFLSPANWSRQPTEASVSPPRTDGLRSLSGQELFRYWRRSPRAFRPLPNSCSGPSRRRCCPIGTAR
jgi:2-polyprenyl-6-methoxyphenol hydroxylase-like FAD-dependent oxidoreductase